MVTRPTVEQVRAKAAEPANVIEELRRRKVVLDRLVRDRRPAADVQVRNRELRAGARNRLPEPRDRKPQRYQPLVHLRRKGEMAILVVEQYFEWARDIADDYAVMDRGAVVLSGTREAMNEGEVRRWLTV